MSTIVRARRRLGAAKMHIAYLYACTSTRLSFKPVYRIIVRCNVQGVSQCFPGFPVGTITKLGESRRDTLYEIYAYNARSQHRSVYLPLCKYVRVSQRVSFVGLLAYSVLLVRVICRRRRRK